MASKTFLPSSIPRSRSILPKQQCRNLSSTSRLFLPAGSENAGAMRGMVQKSMSGQTSMKSQMSRMKKTDLPTDFGLMPNMLIKPEWKDLPPLLSSRWKRRLRIEWATLKQRVGNFIRLIVVTKWNVPKDPITKKSQRTPLLLRERAYMVQKLHSELGKAIAARNRPKIDLIACTGLKSQLRVRFDRLESVRRPLEKWTVEYRGWVPRETTHWLYQALYPRMWKAVRIVYDSQAQFPIDEYAYLRQVVAKVKTKQMLDRGDGQSQTVEREEYVVMQKALIEGMDDKWMIWGTTEPASEKQIDNLLEEGKSESFRENFNRQMEKWSSNANMG